MTAKDSSGSEGSRAARSRVKRFRIEVPATSSNLGPGFDALALALNIVDTIDVSLHPGSKDVVLEEITGGNDLVLDPSDNLLCRAYRSWEEEFGLSLPGARFRLESRIPVARGLGSSAASVLAGLAAAEIAGKQKPRERVLGLAARLEGHPHTVAAALLGGLITAFQEGNDVHALHVASHLALDVVVFVPANRPHKDARNVVHETVSVRDAVYNLSRSAYITAALSWGRWEQIGQAMDDRLQQPYVRRIAPSMDDVLNTAQKAGALGVLVSIGDGPEIALQQPYLQRLLPFMDDVINAARQAGALGAWLSGDGPAIAALATPDQSQAVANAMQSGADATGWPGAVRVTNVREAGLQVRKLGRPRKSSH